MDVLATGANVAHQALRRRCTGMAETALSEDALTDAELDSLFEVSPEEPILEVAMMKHALADTGEG